MTTDTLTIAERIPSAAERIAAVDAKLEALAIARRTASKTSERRRRKLSNTRDNQRRVFQSLVAERLRLQVQSEMARNALHRAGARIDLMFVSQQVASIAYRSDIIDRQLPTDVDDSEAA